MALQANPSTSRRSTLNSFPSPFWMQISRWSKRTINWVCHDRPEWEPVCNGRTRCFQLKITSLCFSRSTLWVGTRWTSSLAWFSKLMISELWANTRRPPKMPWNEWTKRIIISCCGGKRIRWERLSAKRWLPSRKPIRIFSRIWLLRNQWFSPKKLLRKRNPKMWSLCISPNFVKRFRLKILSSKL